MKAQEASGQSREESWAGLHEEIGRLAERHRGPVVLCGLEGLTHDQAAARLGVPVRTVQRRLVEAKIPLDGASDHGVSEALYLRDPDENGVELYWDRPAAQWPRRPDGSLAMFTHRLDLEDLLRQRVA